MFKVISFVPAAGAVRDQNGHYGFVSVVGSSDSCDVATQLTKSNNIIGVALNNQSVPCVDINDPYQVSMGKGDNSKMFHPLKHMLAEISKNNSSKNTVKHIVNFSLGAQFIDLDKLDLKHGDKMNIVLTSDGLKAEFTSTIYKMIGDSANIEAVAKGTGKIVLSESKNKDVRVYFEASANITGDIEGNTDKGTILLENFTGSSQFSGTVVIPKEVADLKSVKAAIDEHATKFCESTEMCELKHE